MHNLCTLQMNYQRSFAKCTGQGCDGVAHVLGMKCFGSALPASLKAADFTGPIYIYISPLLQTSPNHPILHSQFLSTLKIGNSETPLCIAGVAGWPTGPRGWFWTPVSPETWVRIPLPSATFAGGPLPLCH